MKIRIKLSACKNECISGKMVVKFNYTPLVIKTKGATNHSRFYLAGIGLILKARSSVGYNMGVLIFERRQVGGVNAKVLAKVLHRDKLVLLFVGMLSNLFDNFTALALAFSSDQLDVFGVNTNAGHKLVFFWWITVVYNALF